MLYLKVTPLCIGKLVTFVVWFRKCILKYAALYMFIVVFELFDGNV